MCVHFQEYHTALPPISHYTLFYPLGQNPETNPVKTVFVDTMNLITSVKPYKYNVYAVIWHNTKS